MFASCLHMHAHTNSSQDKVYKSVRIIKSTTEWNQPTNQPTNHGVGDSQSGLAEAHVLGNHESFFFGVRLVVSQCADALGSKRVRLRFNSSCVEQSCI